MSVFERRDALARLAAEEFDVLVVGGGITGAGVALDAASRGLRTALVDKGDFASGTSSRSSKLVHGGLRYLQQGELGLVYESLAERQALLRNAAHLVSPLPFLIPIFGRDGVVRGSVARSLSTALWLYDLTGGWRIGTRHRRVGRDEALAHLPVLRADDLAGGFVYPDAHADDARLVLAVARTAVLDHGAVAANYAEVTALLTDRAGKVHGARVSPAVMPGAAGAFGDAATGPDFDVRAKAVVNATGVWADDVRALAAGA
jgi:glycerol-3-phosphate dehydrogenase